MKKKPILLALAATLLTGSALAGTMGPIQQPDWSWVGTFSAGPVWQNAGSTQTFYLAPSIEKSYVAHKSSNILFDGEVFLGMQKRLSEILQGQLGLAVAATSDVHLSGMVWDDGDPLFYNYDYRYKIQHTHVAVKGKLLADAGFWLVPWVNGSIGVGFNDAHSFNNVSRIFEALPNPNFASHTKTSFTYTVGAGVQKALNEHWQVGVGYEFADWGKSRLGHAREQTLNAGLGLNHVYTNGVLFNFTYIS